MSLACETEIGVQNELALRFTIVSKPTPTLEYIKSISSLVGASHILAVFEENDTLKVFFDDKKLIDTLIRSVIHVLGHHVRVDYVVPPGSKVFLSNIDPIVSNYDLTRLLSMYGAIVSPIICPPISDEMEYCHISHGARYCYMKINQPIPNKLEFKYGDQLCVIKIRVADELTSVTVIKSDEIDVIETDNAPEACSDVDTEHISPCPVVVSVESTATVERTESMENTASVEIIESKESTASVESVDGVTNSASIQDVVCVEDAVSAQNVVRVQDAVSAQNVVVRVKDVFSVQNAASEESVTSESSTDVHLGVAELPIERDYVQNNRSQQTLKMKRIRVSSTARAAKRIKSSVKMKWIGKKENKAFRKGKRGRKPLRLLRKSLSPSPSPPPRLLSLSPTTSDDDDHDFLPPLSNNQKKDIFKNPLTKEEFEEFIDECKHNRTPIELAKKYLGRGCDDDAMRSLIKQIENRAEKCTSYTFNSLKLRLGRLCKILTESLEASKS